VELKQSIVIERPIDDVFALAGNPDNDPRWGGLIIESRQLQDGPIHVGTLLEQTAILMGARFKTTIEVTRFNDGGLVCYRTSAPVTLEHCRSFESVPEGTKLTFHTTIQSGGRLQFGETLLRKVGERRMESDLEALKDLLEGRAG